MTLEVPVVESLAVTTTTLYADAAGGRILSNDLANTTPDADYAIARAGNALNVDTTGTTSQVGQTQAFGAYNVYEGFMAFDTSAVDLYGMQSASLSLVMTTGGAVGERWEARAYDWGPTLTAADWVPGANLAALPLVAHWDGDGTGTQKERKWTDDGLMTRLNPAGFTRLLLCSAKTVLGTRPPLDPSTVQVVTYGDSVGGGTLPRLTIVTDPEGQARADKAMDIALQDAFWPERGPQYGGLRGY